MALSTIIRRSLSTVAARVVAGQRIRHAAPAISTLISRHINAGLSPANGFSSHHRNFSAASDKKLLDSIKDIKFDLQSKVQDVKLPDRFPFEIEVNHEARIVTLHRNYQLSDTVTIEVGMPGLGSNEDRSSESESSCEPDDESSRSLVVRVTKYNGSALRFACIAFPDKITIERLFIEDAEQDSASESGHVFSTLDENLQKAFQEYIEIRGVTPSTTNFLSDYISKYMIKYEMDKKNEDYLEWLDNLKKIVEMDENGGESDIRMSNIEEFMVGTYEDLVEGRHQVVMSDGTLRCPFCPPEKKKQGYEFGDLLQHARGISTSTARRRSEEVRASHRALEMFMMEHLRKEEEHLPSLEE